MEHHRRYEARPYSDLKNKAVDKKVEEDGDDGVEEEEDGGELGFEIDEKKKKIVVVGGSGRRGSAGGGGGGGGGGGAALPRCQVEKCASDLTDAKRYHRRHKVCEVHAKAPAVVVGGLRQRFCQQCSRFHELAEFDDAKKSCRKRLAGHNERRRKNLSESQGEGSSRRGLDQCWQTDERGRAQITIPGNPSIKHFHIR